MSDKILAWVIETFYLPDAQTTLAWQNVSLLLNNHS